MRRLDLDQPLSLAACLLLLFFSVWQPVAASGAHDHALGRVEFPISCSEAAQVEFNRGLALLHHMTYPQSRAAFEQVLERDARCAMGHWGVAMTLFQPLWPTRPSPDDLRRGREALQKARALQPPTQREQRFIATADAFFAAPEDDYWARIRRWAQAAAQQHDDAPNDIEATLFHALAQLATTPANASTRENADKAAALLVRVYEQQPDHPGAMHYLVHANDVPGREHELLEVTRKYEQIAPNNPHALHMPTHIYTRLGDWERVINGNLRAAQAALAHPAGARGELVWDEFPHAVEYLIYAYLQRGDDAAAAEQLKRLHSTQALEPTFKTAFHLASTQSRFALERRAWAEAAQITPRSPPTLDWDRFAWAEAITRFAHGLGATHLAQLDKARSEVAQLEQLRVRAETAGEALFARNIRVLELGLTGWMAQQQGEHAQARALLHEAAELEAATPKHAVTPAPTLPAYELLGDLLFAQRDFNGARAAYQRALELYPNRFNSLLGAARAAQAAGERDAARGFYQELLAVAAPNGRKSALAEAQTVVARK